MNTAKSTDSAALSTPVCPAADTGAPRARRGKIARLPLAWREELNRRLADGEAGADLLAWLHARPETQALLTEAFAGRPVTEQNLSDWRQGGFRDWERQQERLAWARDWTESAQGLTQAAGDAKLSAALNQVLLAQLGVALEAALAATDEPATQFDKLVEMAGLLARLRREETNAEKARIATAKWDQEVAREKERAARPTFANPQGALLMQKTYLDLYRPAGTAADA